MIAERHCLEHILAEALVKGAVIVRLFESLHCDVCTDFIRGGEDTGHDNGNSTNIE